MDILENDLAIKYFGCCCETAGCLHPHEAILKSMQEPIKKGDKVLTMMRDGTPELTTVDSDEAVAIIGDAFHPHYLRLPDKFQTVMNLCPKCKRYSLTAEGLCISQYCLCAHNKMPPCGFCGAIPTYQSPGIRHRSDAPCYVDLSDSDKAVDEIISEIVRHLMNSEWAHVGEELRRLIKKGGNQTVPR